MKARDLGPYVQAVKVVTGVVRTSLQAGCRPRFRLPPKKVLVAGDLGQWRDRISLNADARDLCKAIAEKLPDATVMMLEIGLERCRVPIERTLAALGGKERR